MVMGHDEQEEHAAGHGHLVLFPFLAQGHLIPFLNLAKRIESLAQPRRPATITIVSTPRNVASLRRAVPPGSSIRFAELPFSPSDHGLQADAESLDVISFQDIPAFFFATESSLQAPFRKLVSDLAAREGCSRNVCVLADIFLGWTADTARALGVQHRVFVTSGAYASAVMHSIWLHPPAFPRPVVRHDEERALVDFPDVRVRYVEFLNVAIDETGTNDMTRYLRRTLGLHFDHSGGLVINTAEEVEPEGLEMIGKISGLPVFAVGPLIGGRDPSDTPPPADDACIKFLDSKPPASVLYVSFGSQNTIPASQMVELARGLEASGRPFIWVVRPPEEFDGAAEFRAEWLPDGFEDRVAAAAQGLVVRRWAPQVAILAHASTGAFLSHCGWNSVLESMWHGVPVLGWPLLADQLFDSRLLEKLGVAVQVASCRFIGGLAEAQGWEHVRDVVNTVLGDGDKARDMRRKAAELKELVRAAVNADDDVVKKGSSVLAMERFLNSTFL